MGANRIYLNGEYVQKNPSYHVNDSLWKVEQILKVLRRHSLPIHSVCEIGCGAGEVLRQLQLHLDDDIEFDGYDISPHAIALAEQRKNDRLHFYCAEISAISIAEMYDLALCIDVFEHVDDYMNFLRTLHEKSVYKIFHIPLEMTAINILRNKPIYSRSKLGHLHYFMKDTALAALKDTGYEIIDFFYTAGALELQKGGWGQKLLRIPRKILGQMNQDVAVRILGGYSLLVLAK